MFKPPIGRLFCCPVFISSFWVDNVVSCNQAEEESRVNLGSESETVEFKKSTGEHKEALQAISAMLNKHGGGELYFGVKDNGDVIGQDVTDSTIRQVAGWIADKIEPPISPTIERLAPDDGRTYVRVTFAGVEGPYSADGRYFIRIGTSNKAMTASELSTMIIKRDRARNPWDSKSSGRPASDIDEKALRDLVRLGNEAGRIPTGFTSARNELDRLRLIAADGTLTNAADVLLCEGRDLCPRMKLGLFKTNTKAQIADMRREQGPMLELLDLAERYVVRNIRSEVVIGKAGMRRQEIPEVPLEAIRETLANALCHRDYTTGTSVQVNVFKDFVEIVSPGLFPEGDSPEKHLSGDANEFHPRNPLIAEALYKADVIEQYGTGIPRIKEACEAAGVSFKFEQTITSTVVRFDLPGAREDKNAATLESAAAPIEVPTLSENERIAIDMAAKHGKATPKTLASQAQISRKTASLVLKGLEKKGVLRWSGKSTMDPYQFYELPN